jgi:tetratricopeptide (TPR) repeat protein
MVDIPAAGGASVIRTQLDAAPSISYREQGNDEYRRGNYLRAAALYTKALKDDPECAALYSNRSAALLHVNKLSKALTDADQCIRLEPEWDKGHYRRGAALEALDRLEEVSLHCFSIASPVFVYLPSVPFS